MSVTAAHIARLVPALLLGALIVGHPRPAAALDTAPWDAVLRAHANRGGVDYAALKADAEAMGQLDRFLAGVATLPASAGLADWLNAYNATVVKAVVERYPLASVRDVPGCFDRVTHRIAGQERTLDAVENEIIRPRFEDARVHFALNCGARSCPALAPRAFRAGSLDRTLDGLVRRALRSPLHLRVVDGTPELSKLFEWFAADFTRGGETAVAWARRFDARGVLEGIADDATPRFRRYDWRLNDRPR